MAEIGNLIISALVFSAIVIGFSGFYGDMATSNGATDQPTSLSYLNKSQEIAALSSNLQNQLNRTTSVTSFFIYGPSIIGTITAIIGTGIGLVIYLITGVITALSQLISVPPWLTWIVISIVTLVIVFALLRGGAKIEI